MNEIGESGGSVIRGEGGVAATGSPLVTQAAIDVLRRGGNAVDAAIAAAAVQSVVEFPAGGLGGDAFLLIRDGDGSITAFNGSGPAPSALAAELVPGAQMPRFGPLSVGVPGFVDAICAAHGRYGEWPLTELMAPAVDYARGGFPLSIELCAAIDRVVAQLEAGSALDTFLRRATAAPGASFVQARLAETLEAVAEGGRDAFYTGDVARSLSSHIQSRGGVLAPSDLADHSADFVAPISARYHGAMIHVHPPVSLGAIALQELRLYEHLGLGPLDPADPVRIDAMVRCKHAAFADTMAALREDPGGREPVEQLLTDAHIAARGETLLSIAPAELARPLTVGTGSDTTCLTVADDRGCTAVVIHSLFNEFGSREFDAETGILLNDRLANQPAGEGAGQITGGRKPLHTLTGFMVERDGGGSIVAGATPGGRGQVQTNFQFIVNLIDCEMNPQSAIDAPRWLSGAPRRPEPDEQLYVEPALGGQVAEELQRRGHAVTIASTADTELFGSLVAVGADATGSMIAAADGRREATAEAF